VRVALPPLWRGVPEPEEDAVDTLEFCPSDKEAEQEEEEVENSPGGG
tara:strand:- start:361 stop:501 length:141 start_codon:yes stop_codon:yes gene_type:complete